MSEINNQRLIKKVEELEKANLRHEKVIGMLISYLHRELGTACATNLLNHLSRSNHQ